MAPPPTDPATVADRVARVVRDPAAQALMCAYFDPTFGFAGALFDGRDDGGLLGENPLDRFTADDIAAASLLDVRFGPRAVRSLLADRVVSDALAAVPVEVTLWEATHADIEAATRLWRVVRAVDGVGRTRASKLLARRRPHLVPIVDSVIAAALALTGDTWRPLAEVLRDPDLRRDIEALRPVTVSSEISLLRLLDVVVWTIHSRSTAAVRLQQKVGAAASRSLPRDPHPDARR